MTIYISTPASAYTGGPTALFQLCKTLQEIYHVDTYIAVYGVIQKDPVHPNYKNYSCKWIPLDNVEDSSSNYIIIPESVPYLLNRFHKIQKIIYFLSVDNYIKNVYPLDHILKIIPSFSLFMLRYYSKDIINLNILKRFNLNTYYNEFLAKRVKNIIYNEKITMPDNVLLYLAQSRYAAEFLKQHKIEQDNILLIHEPLEDEFIKRSKEINLNDKKNAIAWNPRKSYPIVSKLLKRIKEKYKVYELENVGKQKIIELLSQTKIYIDIGIHPGRDRPPREAVALWNIPLVNNHGGLFYDEDFPISSKLKLNCYDNCNNISIDELYERTIDLINNYDFLIKEINQIRQYIMAEPDIFRKDIEVFLKKIGFK